MDCEVELHKFILKNKPFADNQVVRCVMVDDINDGEGQSFKQEETGN